MKKSIFAVLALTSMSVMAQNHSSVAGFDGFVSLSAGSSKVSVPDESDRSGTSGLRASFAYTHNSGFGLQVDTLFDNQKLGFGGDNLKIRANDLAFHPYYRQENFLLGGIYQTRDFKVKFDSSSGTLPLDRTFTGLQGQYAFGQFTVFGLTARDKISAFMGGPTNTTGRTNIIEGRYFLNDNLRIDLSHMRSKFSDFDSKARTTSIGAEYKFAGSPFSVFGKYQNTNGSEVDTKRFFLGATLNFGKETLKSRNSSGASLNPIPLDNQILNIGFN